MNRFNGIRWKGIEDPAIYNSAANRLGDFFEGAYQYTSDPSNSIIDDIDFSGITYREGQANYAFEIMEAIKRRQILIIQAGVGIGKSFGYLLPIFYTMDSVDKFKKVIISTSSIALQEQLLGDIKKISEMLGIEIKADIAKGINNYACLNRIFYKIDNHVVDSETEKVLRILVNEIRRIKSCDKSDLQQLSKDVWEEVRLKNRGYCSKCDYSIACPYYKKQESISSSNIVITNHANMVRNVIDETDLIKDVDMLVFDEAHKLVENIQGIRTEELDLESIKRLISSVSNLLSYKYSNNGITFRGGSNYFGRDNRKLFEALDKLFSRIMASASKNFFTSNKENGNDYSIIDSNRLGFRNTPTVNEWLDVVLIELNKLISDLINYEKKTGVSIDINIIKSLRYVKDIFEDMKKGIDSDYIYWADFYKKNRIKILRIPKGNFDVTKAIFSSEIPVLLTSGTLTDINEKYSRFSGSIQIDKLVGRSIRTGEEQPSPYDYSNNSLLYYNPSIANPNDKEKYIRDLAVEISELIKITNGKALILFTSKKTMNEVYALLEKEKFSFELLLQNDNNASEVKEQFFNDTDSCLFATGAFWEGIDIKGKALSNLIITRLPFDQVDAVTQYEASKYAESERFSQVYFPNMLTKFQQAIGRLIRSDTDTGIVCCLDSRIVNYMKPIRKSIPIDNFVTDKEELYKFAENKILDSIEVQNRHQ